MNWRAFFSGVLGGALVVATLTLPQMKAQTPWGAYPTGNVTMTLNAACPTGTAEISAFNGAMPYGTIAANGDVGATGGANTITPAGSNATANFTPAGTVAAPVFTGSAGTVPAETISWPAGVPTFSGSALGTHTHTVTPTGTNGTASVGTTSGSLAGSSTGAFSKIGNVSPGSSFTVPAETFTGTQDTTSAVSAGTPAGTVAWPAGVPTNATASFTPIGTNSAPAFIGAQGTIPAETWTGNSFDNRSAFVKVIFCQKT
jgi:hypothetical protein